MERNIRHCISIGWRTKQSGMEDVTKKALVRPPAPRYFVYRSAEYLMGLEE
nr:MAG TPA: Stage 0 sporulation protein A/DNA, transcriptional activation and repression.3A [Caudoviricetes sp.]